MPQAVLSTTWMPPSFFEYASTLFWNDQMR